MTQPAWLRQVRLSETLTAAVARRALDVGASCAYLSGSRAVSLDNPRSDIDAFFIVPDDISDHAPTEQVLIGQERLDVETYRVSQVAATVEQIVSARYGQQGASQLDVSVNTIDFCCRALYGTVVYGRAGWEELFEPLRLDDTPLRHFATAWWAWKVSNQSEDFMGAVEAGEPDQAIHTGERLLINAGKAFAAALGDYYTPARFVYTQLRRSAPPSFPYQYFVELLRGSWFERGFDGSRDVMAMTQSLLIAAETTAWDLSGSLPWDAWPDRFDHSTTRARSIDVLPLRGNDGVTLHHERVTDFQVSVRALVVWGLAHLAEDEFRSELDRLGTHFAIDADHAMGLLAELRARGLAAPAV